MDAQQMNEAFIKFQKSYFDVLGLCCSSEVTLIENILKPLDGIREVSVIVPSRTVIVDHDSLLISKVQIVKALNQARLEANIRVYGDNKHQKNWPSPYAMASGLLLVLSFLKYVYSPLQWLALGAVAAGILPIVLKAIVAIRNYRLDINILMLIAVVGTIAMNDYTEAGTIVFLFSIAEWLESWASHKASAMMSSLMNLAPQKAVIAETGEVVNADEVKVNTILAVKAGEVIPIDGIVVDGTCELDEKTLTGESFPVTKQKDSIVWAGTINLNGYVSVKTTALANDCVVAKMAKLVEEAQNSKSRTQRFIDRCAKFYTPAVLVSAALLAVVPVALRVHNQKEWFRLALVVLVCACPCALILSTPVATFCALTKAATYGLLIKGGDCLETLAKVKVIAFDKTGTITRGEFVVTDFRSLCSDIDLNSLLYWVSSIESKSSHPMSDAIVDYGRSFSIEPKPEEVKELQNFPGEGIYGNIDGRDVYIGNRKIGIRAGSEIVPAPALQGDTEEGRTIGFIYLGTTPIGIFALSDACRFGVVEAIRELDLLGIKTAMLTGDSHAAAMHAQDQLGGSLELIYAELLPEDKVKIITAFRKEGPTAMVGDGLNDAPALATADIGISMGISGSALASETGNMILMSNDIRGIPKAIRLARKAYRKVIENVILSISTKAVILGLAFAGHPLVWAAVLADVGTCLIVIFNSMLLLHQRHKHGGKCCKSSTAPGIHKNKCSATIIQSSHHDHHNHQCCCSGSTQNESQPQKCCPGNTQNASHTQKCFSGTTQNASEAQKYCSGTRNSSQAQKCCSGNIRNSTHAQKCASQKFPSSCQSTPSTAILGGETTCTNSAESHDKCKRSDWSHEENNCHQRSSNKGKQKFESRDMNNICYSGPQALSLGTADKFPEANHCHQEICDKGKHRFQSSHVDNCDHPGFGNLCLISEDKCAYSHLKQGTCVEDTEFQKHSHSGCCSNVTRDISLKKREYDSCCKGFPKEYVEFPVSMSLANREMGDCCKSYIKDCCSKQRHLGSGFGGGLSEIITEKM